jgi:hypothetical protein
MNTLPGKAAFQDLTRDVDWQRASFLTHCLEIVEQPPQNNVSNGSSETVVQKILFDYFLLALLYYRNCRRDLKTNYETQGTLTESDVKISLQCALDKLISEWYRVYSAITAIRASSSNHASEEMLKQIMPVVQAAKDDLGLADLEVVLQFGQYYSLGFSNYTAKITALSMPLMAMDSPWEWTILWHELAGEKVRLLKRESPEFLNAILDRALEQLGDDKQTAQERGWSVDWVEELFEDSFSVFHFPIHFLVVLENLLERYSDGGKGNRHPSHAIRLASAMTLQMQGKHLSVDTNLNEWKKDLSVWCSVWNELDAKDDLSVYAGFDPHNLLSDAVDIKMVWMVAKEILDWHESQNKIPDPKYGAVRAAVGNAIKKYSLMNFSQEGEREGIVGDINKKIEAFNASFASNKAEGFSIANSQLEAQQKKIKEIVKSKRLSGNDVLGELAKLEQAEENQLIKQILGGLDFRQLLDLNFYDEDFNMEWITDIRLNGVNSLANFQYGGVWDIDDVSGAGLLQQAVTYKKSGVPHTTTKLKWNGKFGEHGPRSL